MTVAELHPIELWVLVITGAAFSIYAPMSFWRMCKENWHEWPIQTRAYAWFAGMLFVCSFCGYSLYIVTRAPLHEEQAIREQSAANLPPNRGYSREDLEYTAKLHGLTPEQVEEELRKRNAKTPLHEEQATQEQNAANLPPSQQEPTIEDLINKYGGSAANLLPNRGYSQEDLEYTAKLYGITPEQVLQIRKQLDNKQAIQEQNAANLPRKKQKSTTEDLIRLYGGDQ